MARFPWLPVEEDGRLHDPVLRENFVERIYALHELNSLREEGLTRGKLIAYHSRYKLHCWPIHSLITANWGVLSPRYMSGNRWTRGLLLIASG